MSRVVSFAALSLVMVNLSGCVDQMVLNSMAQASLDSETPESVSLAPANFRGKTCLELAVDRQNAGILLSNTGEHADYVQKHGRWTHASVEQVEQEQGCMPGTTVNQAGAIDYILQHPESLKELQADLPPGGLEYIKAGGKLPAGAYAAAPTATASVPASAPQPTAHFQGSTSERGSSQTSLAQWVAKETPEAYHGKSCDYLNVALIRSAQLGPEFRDLADSKKKAIDHALSGRDCPAPSPFLPGRVGAAISSMDPIKAARLGMPLEGASIEKISPGGPAERAGLQFADVIVKVDGVPVRDDIDFLVGINKVPTGSATLLQIFRKGAYANVSLVLGPPVVVQH
ncbi:MAG: PDZ domain-containing protein [Pseudomonas putida]